MFRRSAAYYDALYGKKDYQAESEKIHALIQEHRRSKGSTLLDAGCGTGAHITYLRDQYEIEGLDREEKMLAVARKRFPEVVFHHADMAEFDLGKQFDAIICLFSAIAYVITLERLRQALSCFRHHTRPGGVVIVEPWYAPGTLNVKTPSVRFAKGVNFELTRMTGIQIVDRVSILNFMFQIVTPDGVDRFNERHEMGLFTHTEYLEAFRLAGMDVCYDEAGIMKRGLYIGVQPLPGQGVL